MSLPVSFFGFSVGASEPGRGENAEDGGGRSLPGRAQPIVARGSAACGPRARQPARIGGGGVVRERWEWG